MLLRVLLRAGAAILLSWLALLVALLVVRPRGSLLREALRLLPDMLRLLRRLASDPTLPPGVKARLWLLLAYLASRSTWCSTLSPSSATPMTPSS
jgi:hypothetical protein